ncbi:hypothetical protein HPB48_014283 [Haemaphysalis longicornis]|uniref:C2H2-type domain-containing protein n=1 Tax=Haemaphysalis longicornis TaxID=44386 RepID=A0A9J6FJC3_HAELO|nr:hypothetical protein HPB48_014283 [Haemaphysalis longicornis]
MDYINSLVMGAQHRDGLALPSLLLVPSLGELVSQFKQDVHYVLAADDGRRREDDDVLEVRRDAKADQQLLVAGDAVKVSGLDFLGAQEDSGEWPSPRRGARALSAALCPSGVQFIKVEAYEDHSLHLDGFARESPLLHENSKDVALSTINQDPSMLLEDLTKHSTAFEEAADMTDLFVTPLGEQNAPGTPLVAQPDGKENKKLKSRRAASPPPAKEDKCCSAPDEPEPGRDKSEPPAPPPPTLLEGKLKITAGNPLATVNLDVLPVDSVILGNFLLVPDAMSPVKFQILHEDGTTIKEVSINAICKLEGTNPVNKDAGAGESPGSLKKTPESAPKNSRPFQCEMCSATFNRLGNYTRHQKIHTVRTKVSSGDLNRHLRSIHLQVKPLMCGHCHKKFAKEATLIRHMRTSHREMLLQSVLKA